MTKITRLSELPNWIDAEIARRNEIPAHWIDKFWRKREQNLLPGARERFIEIANEIITEHEQKKPGLFYREIFTNLFWQRIRLNHGPGTIISIELNGKWIYDKNLFGWNERWLAEVDACIFNSRSLYIRPLHHSDVITVTYQSKAK